MPLYQMYCEHCDEPYEVIMSLDTCRAFDDGKRRKKCPECGKYLKKIICPPKIIRIN